MRIRPTGRASSLLPSRALGGCLAAAGLALVAGCSVAPPGATNDSPPIGPVRTGAQLEDFAPFPVPDVWDGKDNVTFQMIVKAKTGTKYGNVRVIARSEMVFWLNCIGTGTAHLSSPAIGLDWSVPCGDGNNPGGLTFDAATALVGHGFNVAVTVTPGSRWEVRVDGTAKKGVKVPPDTIPKR